MRLKSFHGTSLSDAMRQVRETLGDDAIIVSTRDDDAGGIRVTAAIDDMPAKAAPAAPQAPMTEQDDVSSDQLDIISSALIKHMVPTILAERLMATATQTADDDPIVSLASAFDTHLKFDPILDDATQKPIVLIGPPGAGKTLCTAKFATKAALAKKKIMPITTDIERAGGVEQLAVFTRLLNVNLIEVEDAPALHDMMEMKNSDALVLVDTPGRNPFNTTERDQLVSLVKACGGEAVLVMPAGLDANEAVDMAQAFKEIGATRLLFTRLDMIRRFGSMVRIASETSMALANFSLSHKVTDAPHSFNPVTLAHLFLPHCAKTATKATGTR